MDQQRTRPALGSLGGFTNEGFLLINHRTRIIVFEGLYCIFVITTLPVFSSPAQHPAYIVLSCEGSLQKSQNEDYGI